jgi:transposase
LVSLTPYYPHQVIELPPIDMEISHCMRHQGACAGCGKVLKAQVPQAHQTGYGPRLTALIGELGGMHRTSRRLIQDCCRSVLHLPLSLALQEQRADCLR